MSQEAKLVFTSDETKTTPKLNENMRIAFAMAHFGAIITNGQKSDSSAEDMRRAMTAGHEAQLRENPGLRKAGVLRFVELIADRFPDMRLSVHVALLMQGMAYREEHREILAASLAWVSLGRARAVDVEELTHTLLPHGPPTEAYMEELRAYYEERPDLLWPSGLTVETLQ